MNEDNNKNQGQDWQNNPTSQPEMDEQDDPFSENYGKEFYSEISRNGGQSQNQNQDNPQKGRETGKNKNQK